jgi:putative transposase
VSIFIIVGCNNTLKNILSNLIIEHKKEIKLNNKGRKLKNSLSNYIDSFFYILRTGCNWKFLEELKNFNLHYSTYYKHFIYYQKIGIFDELLNISLKISSFYNNTNNYYIDSSTIKNLKSFKSSNYSSNSYKLKSILSTKITILINDKGLPVNIHYSKSSKHDINFVIPSILNFNKKNNHKLNKSILIGDKGYMSNKIKKYLKQQYNMDYIYPSKSNSIIKNNNNLIKSRFINEQIFAWINNYKRINNINEKYYLSFMSFYNLAISDYIFKKIEKIIY